MGEKKKVECVSIHTIINSKAMHIISECVIMNGQVKRKYHRNLNSLKAWNIFELIRNYTIFRRTDIDRLDYFLQNFLLIIG